jgi:hypothetical protein
VAGHVARTAVIRNITGETTCEIQAQMDVESFELGLKETKCSGVKH